MKNLKQLPYNFALLSCILSLLPLVLGSCVKNRNDDGMLDYSQSAKALYEEAMIQFDSEDCIEAEKLFLDVRKKFPYSKYAVEAEIRLSDCHFMQGNHAEAAVAFQHFVKAHPTHNETHYAAYKRAESFYEMIPGDFFITPPSHERDQSAVRDARTAFRAFLKTYVKSEWIEKATDKLMEVEDALVRHEMYVAEFYLRRDDQKAAVVRLEGIRQSFPESRLVPDAMFLQATTFLKMDLISDAKRMFGEIVTHYPKHYQARRSGDYLRHLAQ